MAEFPSRIKFRHFLSASVMASVMATSAWAFWLEPASLTSKEELIQLPEWPQACSNMDVAVLADIHTGSPFNHLDKLDEIVQTTNSADPDMVLLAGDYVIQGVVGGTETTIEVIAEHLGKLEAPMGVYAVLGNHDWWLDATRVIDALETAGITVLEDRNQQVTAGDCSFWLAGVSDLWEGAADVDQALAGIPEGAPTLVFTHNPDVFDDIPASVALTVAGHTHGGQIHLPVIGSPVQYAPQGSIYNAGHFNEDGRQMYVSTGLGTSVIGARFRVPPEISVLNLRSAPLTVASGQP